MKRLSCLLLALLLAGPAGATAGRNTAALFLTGFAVLFENYSQKSYAIARKRESDAIFILEEKLNRGADTYQTWYHHLRGQSARHYKRGDRYKLAAYACGGAALGLYISGLRVEVREDRPTVAVERRF